jgi:MFS family permease
MKFNLSGFRRLKAEYPSQFWILILAVFIDRVGGAMLFPFFTLYLTRKFDIGMTQVGLLFMVFSITGVLGSIIGGALTDRLGRKSMVMFGLVMSATSSLLMGVVNELELFFLVVLVVGLMAESGGPAHQALVADLLPEEKRAEGFGIIRVVANLAVTIGPLIGGLLAVQSYLLLFVVDAVTSLVTAGIVLFTLKETWKPQEKGQEGESLVKTFSGYGVALRDKAFIWYLLASALMVIVYMNMNTTLAVYLRDMHGVNERGFSYILSLNAAMVVLFQFAITRRVVRYRPMIVMTVGTLLYAVGFAMYGFISWYPMFLLAMVIITIGEMVVSPVGQAIVARLAPEEMRGRYMAVFGFSWVIPAAVGPLLAGVVLDNFQPQLLWYIAGLVGVVAAGAFYTLERLVDRSRWSVVDQRLRILELLETGQINAESAAKQLAAVPDSHWARLAPAPAGSASRHLRIRVNDLSTGAMKVDLHLPMGVVNTVLHMGGQFSAELDEFDSHNLRELITKSSENGGHGEMEASSGRVELNID